MNNPITTTSKTLITILIPILLLTSCKKNPKSSSSFMVTNESGDQLVVVNTQRGERSAIAPGQSRNIDCEQSPLDEM